MKSITQDLKFKQAVMGYSFNHGVTNAAIRYKKTRQWKYYWRKNTYRGGYIFLAGEISQAPLPPNAHTGEEIQLIENMRRRNPDEGLTMFWIRLKQRGYMRCITSLYRVMQCRGYYEKEKKKRPVYVDMHPKSWTGFWRCIFYGKKRSKQKRYSAEFKISVIMDMRENHLSYRETVRKYWDTQSRAEEDRYKGRVKLWKRIYLKE